MRVLKLPLTSAEVSALLALNECEPATVKLIAQHMDKKLPAPAAVLPLLRKRGLVRRFKWVPPKIQLADELGGAVPRIGKRPYHYQLTLRGRRVARGLTIAARALKSSPRSVRASRGADPLLI